MNTYKRHRFPPDIISCAVWLYHRLNPNLLQRTIQRLLQELGPASELKETLDPEAG
jgi:putative transposase